MLHLQPHMNAASSVTQEVIRASPVKISRCKILISVRRLSAYRSTLIMLNVLLWVL